MWLFGPQRNERRVGVVELVPEDDLIGRLVNNPARLKLDRILLDHPRSPSTSGRSALLDGLPSPGRASLRPSGGTACEPLVAQPVRERAHRNERTTRFQVVRE